MNGSRGGEKGKTTAGKISILFNVQNADCFREETNLHWLRGNQFVGHTALGNFVAFLIP